MAKTIALDSNFDLYTHMKISIKCASPFCEIHDSSFTDYCLGCKRPVCEICRTSFHSTHNLQNMASVNFNSNELRDTFKTLETSIKTFPFFKEPEKFKNSIKQKIRDEFNEIENLLYEIKEGKLEEIDMLFSSFDPTSITETVSDTSKMLNEYIDKYKNFYFEPEVKDEDNVIFLQTYDLFNGITFSLNEYQSIIEEIKNFFNGFENTENSGYSKVKNMLKSIYEEEKKNSLRSTKCIVVSKDSMTNNVLSKSSSKTIKKEEKENKGEDGNLGYKLLNYLDKLKEDFFKDSKEKIRKTTDFIENFKRATFESFKKHGSFVDIEKTVKIFDEKTNKRTNFIKGKANLKFSPSQAKAYSLNGVLPPSSNSSIEEKDSNNVLGTSNVNNAIKRDSMATKDKKFKNPIKAQKGKELAALEEGDEDLDSEEYEEQRNKDEERKNDSFSNDSDDKLLFENDDEIVLENGFGKPDDNKVDKDKEKLKKMFMPLKKDKKPLKQKPDLKFIGNDDKEKFKVNNKLQEIIKENQRLTLLIKKSEDINLVITIMRRYYSYVALEFVRKNFFKLNNKNLNSSNMLLDKKPKEEDLRDNVRLIEGTNEIQIFCREKRKLIKKTVPFNKNLHSTAVFPVGCRSYISRDRLYISGGKDAKNNDLKLFLSYSFKDNKICKLPDLKKARSYHTIIFHENLKSLLVFGGENNKSCEIYDFFLNAWNEIPELNVGRANISIYIDKIGTFAYAFCGSIGNVSNPSYSDAIELLDLVDMNQGWAKVDYNNKANVDLTFTHNGIYPLTEDKILIYGAKESRRVHKVFVIFDLRNFHLLNVDEFYLEDLRRQAAKNPELSKILM